MKDKSVAGRILAAALTLAILLSGCALPNGGYKRYQKEYYELFNTYTVFCGYARNQAEFDSYAAAVHDEMYRLHRLFDIYNVYEGINNLKTVNDNAGASWVEVDASVIEQLVLAKSFCAESGGSVNIAMGSVVRIWGEYRERALAEPDKADIPQMRELRDAAAATSIDDLLIDEAGGRVFLARAGMSLDVGAAAKGFAVQKAIEAAARAGMEAGFISAGGNVSVLGCPPDGRDAWSIGIDSPFSPEGTPRKLFDTVLVTDTAVVTSGNYQRYYTVENQIYHHIIDPETLMPAARYSAVTVLHPDSAVADLLSTALFILSREQGELLLQKYGADAVWILPDGETHATGGYIKVAKGLS